MLRSELIEKIRREFRHELRRPDAEAAVDAIFGAITEGLAQGDRVELRGFGAFSARKTNARAGRNPRTGEPVDIPETHRVYFRSGNSIRARINGQDAD